MSAEILDLLIDLEQIMRAEGHWAGMPPSIEALSSVEPFCVDTLSFTEWLQWIYIPRLRAMIDGEVPLASGSQIQPYAEEAFGAMRVSGVHILKVVGHLDTAMT